MKEFSATARNYVFAENVKDNLVPRVEMIIVVSEPEYKLGVDDLIRERVSETIRFTMNRDGVKLLTKELLDIDKELETLEKKYPPNPAERNKE